MPATGSVVSVRSSRSQRYNVSGGEGGSRPGTAKSKKGDDDDGDDKGDNDGKADQEEAADPNAIPEETEMA